MTASAPPGTSSPPGPTLRAAWPPRAPWPSSWTTRTTSWKRLRTSTTSSAEIYLPFEIFEKYKDYTSAPEINPNYLLPKQVQTRLQKLMDEYVAGCSTMYMTNKPSLEEGLKRLTLLKEDATRLAAGDLHELMRAWEQYHRILSGEAHLRHILFREETRYPGYYYRSDFLSIDDSKWKVFTISQYDMKTNDWKFDDRALQAVG